MSILANLEPLDIAIATKLSGLSVDGQTVPVQYRNPEEEFSPSSLPVIVIYRTGSVSAKQRICTDKFYDNYVEENGNLISVDVRNAPIPIDVLYIIRPYYEYQQHGVLLTSHILKTFPPTPSPSFVTIESVDYDIVFNSHYTPGSWGQEFGEFKQKQDTRKFYEQFMYYAEIDLDVFTRTTVKTVQELIITASQTP